MNRDELLTKLAMELEEWPRVGCPHDELPPLPTNWRWKESPSSGTPMVFPENNGKPIRAMRYLQRRTELINRPSWDDAPEWAQWLAQDASGRWMWYGDEPSPIYDTEEWQPESGKFCTSSIGTIPAGHNWRDTPEPRPQTQSDIKNCRHCDIAFNRPHVDGIPDDRCTRCDDEIKALWPEHEPAKTWWTSKTCIECGHATAAKVSDDKPVCPGCVALSYAEDSDSESALSQSIRDLADKHPEPITAESILRAGVGHMRDRASTYDKPQGERSMAATVDAFKATTGIEITEEQGWHFMALLKLVRSQQGALRMDSYEDGAAYMALAGEAAAKDRGE